MLNMIILLASLTAQATEIPTVDGRLLPAGTTCYAIVRDAQPLGATLQSIAPTMIGTEPAWDIVVHQRLAGGGFDMRDHFVLRQSDLRPIRFESRLGDRAAGGRWHEVQLSYGERKITGSKATSDGVKQIDVTLDGPVWDGNLWGLTFGALALRENGQYRLPFWQYDNGFGTFLVNVTGSEMVETPDGLIETWVAEAGTSPDRLSRYQLAKRDGAELGYSRGGLEQRLGGDCTGLG